MADAAIARMTELIRSLTEIMRHGNWPPVDYAEERVLFLDGGITAFGVGEAAGFDRTEKAAEAAMADIAAQIPGIAKRPSD